MALSGAMNGFIIQGWVFLLFYMFTHFIVLKMR